MILTCAGLLFQVLYFILDVTFLEFTFIPIFYWFLKDVGIMFISFHYCFDLIAKFCLDIKFYCAQEEFCHFEHLCAKCLGYVSSMNAIFYFIYHYQYHLG